MLYRIFKLFAFFIDPEKIHDSTLFIFGLFPQLGKLFKVKKQISVTGKNISWPHAVGLAAGFDKDGRALDFFSNMGVGAIELGTVTPMPQPGNSKCRVWRYPSRKSLRNTMGFPSLGVDVILKRLKKYNGKAVIGVNIGKNAWTPLESAAKDYIDVYKKIAPYSDYQVINISSPNTKDLRKLQRGEMLDQLLNAFKEAQQTTPGNVFLKISPDEEESEIREIIGKLSKYNLAGIVATNTTIDHNLGSGGVSGNDLSLKAKNIHKLILNELKQYPDLDFIGVGGLNNSKEIKNFIDMGGKFAQVYTGFIFEGPKIFRI